MSISNIQANEAKIFISSYLDALKTLQYDNNLIIDKQQELTNRRIIIINFFHNLSA